MKREKKIDEVPFAPLTQNKFGLLGSNVTDPLGSYTGRPADPLEEPVQDADDL